MPIWKPSNYKDSVRYGHITLEEPQQHGHIRTHTQRTATSDIQQQYIRNPVSKSTVEEIHHIPTGLESVSPFTSAIILGAKFRQLIQLALEPFDASAVLQFLREPVVDQDVHVYGIIVQGAIRAHFIKVRLKLFGMERMRTHSPRRQQYLQGRVTFA